MSSSLINILFPYLFYNYVLFNFLNHLVFLVFAMLVNIISGNSEGKRKRILTVLDSNGIERNRQ